MFGMSLGEMLFIGILGLIVIGPKQLPEVARNIGRFLNELKRVSGGFWEDLSAEAKGPYRPPSPPPTQQPPTNSQPLAVEVKPAEKVESGEGNKV